MLTDDDTWDDEAFIAICEDITQKAEKEHAVKQGTQSAMLSAAYNVVGSVRPTFLGVPASKFIGSGFLDLEPRFGTPVYSEEAQNDSRVNAVLEDTLSDRNGEISLLRSRLIEAEQQLVELRKRASTQESLQSSLPHQRELERLASQLLFKDHEVKEAQRIRMEKDEQLKVAVAEAATLRQELEALKKSRVTFGSLKRPRDEDAVSQDDHAVNSAALRPRAGTPKAAKSLENRSGLWSPPWMPEMSISEPFQKPSAVATLKNRTAHNGCTSSIKAEMSTSEKSKASGFHTRETLAQPSESETAADTSELSYALLQIWDFKGLKTGRNDLIGKLCSACANDIYVLLSSREGYKGLDSDKMESKQATSQTVEDRAESYNTNFAEKFYNALVKVINGSARSEGVLLALLEFCKLDNVRLHISALRVLHCLLQCDENCRNSLVGRTERPSKTLPDFPNIKGKDEFQGDNYGFYLEPRSSSRGETEKMPLFTSPRIFVNGKATKVLSTRVWAGDSSNDGDEIGRPGSTNEMRLSNVQHSTKCVVKENDFSSANGVCKGPDQMRPGGGKKQLFEELIDRNSAYFCKELNAFLKWTFQVIRDSTNLAVKVEALGIVGVLVAHSEPISERLVFGSLLFHMEFVKLLNEPSGAEIQLQLVRIVHHLLHCPTLLRIICGEEDSDLNAIDPGVQSTCHKITANHAGDIPAVIKEWSLGSTASSLKKELLSGLGNCLRFRGVSIQNYALRRSVMRLITYIASCGDSGVAFLTQRSASGRNLSEMTSRVTVGHDDSRVDGMPRGESSSGQQMAADGSRGSAKVLDVRGNSVSDGVDLEGSLEVSEESEGMLSIPERLIFLIGAELNYADKEEKEEEPGVVDERRALIREVATLLSCLASHSKQSGVVLGHLVDNPRMARLSLSVTTDLVSRKLPEYGVVREHPVLLNCETLELCRSLRRRVIKALSDAANDPDN